MTKMAGDPSWMQEAGRLPATGADAQRSAPPSPRCEPDAIAVCPQRISRRIRTTASGARSSRHAGTVGDSSRLPGVFMPGQCCHRAPTYARNPFQWNEIRSNGTDFADKHQKCVAVGGRLRLLAAEHERLLGS